MPNFGDRWQNPRRLSKGGQALTYLVADHTEEGNGDCVAKIINQTDTRRVQRFENEIEISRSFDHPNLVSVIDTGLTRDSKFPFFVMPYYEQGTLQDRIERADNALDRLKLFRGICRGVAYAHVRGLVHRDLKPSNIFISRDGVPIVGDFGLCYRHEVEADTRLTLTQEAVGARKYMPPEWREGRVESPQPSGDVYSLGKILYWIFVGTEYDGHEEDHAAEQRKVAKIYRGRPSEYHNAREYAIRWSLAHALVDEIISRTVLKDKNRRLESAGEIEQLVTACIDRIQAGGRLLDLRIRQRCLYCQAGQYYPVHDQIRLPGVYEGDAFPSVDLRTANPPARMESTRVLYKQLQDTTRVLFGHTHSGAPLILACDFCGNLQYFRLDLTADGRGENWRP